MIKIKIDYLKNMINAYDSTNAINKIFYVSIINLENILKKKDEIFFTLLNDLKLMKSNKIVFYNLFNNINN